MGYSQILATVYFRISMAIHAKQVFAKVIYFVLKAGDSVPSAHFSL